MRRLANVTITRRPYPAYKPSGVEWLGDMPTHWYDPASVKVGYEISFTRHFYKPLPLRPLEEVRADILALERETDELLVEIVGVRRQDKC